MNTGQVS